ncbi:D-alanyl-lipoteichoic acid biosynthesis protein DltB [Streptococcus hillyeri]|uniref:Teichoic acid D-alanyltransferase n=1 Tax=Streptococcus hillyeri TaxID=2282420 RepID=A0A3L9DQB9_9STRE|nr:D-alanyl-lipoteichoic acid biosynthesis protein DltB [Streptococcus hillyeri]RLY01859.1 D-alanyl-lipoteichoic acid biosynthesis protein DltB [Streptococcus hillyeri]
MSDFLLNLPHLEVYGNPQYFVYVILGALPIFIGLFFKKRFPIYEAVVSLVFIVLMLTGKELYQIISLVIYTIWQVLLLISYKYYCRKPHPSWVFYLWVFLAIFPLMVVKINPLMQKAEPMTLFGFLGISYLTFRTVGMIMEMRDGVLKDFTVWQLLRFLLFMPTFSSGPIDRFRRFNEEYEQIPDRSVLFEMLDQSVRYLMKGFLYKYILAYAIGQLFLNPLKSAALLEGGFFNLPTLGVMYAYGLYLFFDFAGYSLFAIAISNLFGIRSPHNFDLPFKSRDLKEFWNRWHMSLSFWFRDYVFMRLVKVMLKNKLFNSRNVTSGVAYLMNMVLMGLWHGVTWYYIAYGVFHGCGLIVNDWWLRQKKMWNKERKQKGQKPLPENQWMQALGIFVTFNVVMFSFLIFSGFLDQLWFPKR